MTNGDIAQDRVETLYQKLRSDAMSGGYFLNPDEHFCRDLVRGLVVNGERYGYLSCPCRLASGEELKDMDIVCPCDYRDQDITEYGACYCALYVSQAAVKGEKSIVSVPERRPATKEASMVTTSPPEAATTLPYPVWRCKVCGYLCAREEPPEICPVCKARKERFERFM